jgi:hypothetical protein
VVTCHGWQWHLPGLSLRRETSSCSYPFPLLKDLGLKLITCPAVTPGTAPPVPAAAASSTMPAAPVPPPSGVATSAVPGSSGSVATPAAFVALVIPAVAPVDEYDTDDNFRWDGKECGITYGTPASKLSESVLPYPPSPSCSHSQVVAIPTPGASSISLPPPLAKIIAKISKSSACHPMGGCLAVADSGATDHMVPDKSAFISYKSISHLKVRMGNNSYIPVQVQGSAIFGLNGKRVLIRNVLHIPGLGVPLYSLRTHMTQRGCGFFGSESSGFLVYFPEFVLLVDTSVDCHLSYESLGSSAPLNTLHYVQPRCAPSLYLSERLPSSSTLGAIQSSPPPALVINDDTSVVASALDRPSFFTDVSSLSRDLARLQSAVDQLICSVPVPVQLVPVPPDSSSDTPEASPSETADDSAAAPQLLSTMTPKDVACLVRHPGTSFSPVRPCDTANASNTKTHLTAEELHWIMGCRKFRNYKHLLQVSRDGE